MNICDKLEEIKFLLHNGDFLSTKDLVGKNLVVYFYPKDDTPGCTKEAIEFSQLHENFKQLQTNIIGVSKDTIEKHQKFIQKYKLKIKLASDEDLTICKLFNTWVEKSMYGKKYMGIERTTFLFDEDLKLIKVWNKVKVKDHAQEVLNFISN